MQSTKIRMHCSVCTCLVSKERNIPHRSGVFEYPMLQPVLDIGIENVSQVLGELWIGNLHDGLKPSFCQALFDMDDFS